MMLAPISFGDIYLVNFDPSVGREYRKVRPGLIIQEQIVSELSPYLTVMPISSKTEKLMPSDILISKDEKNRLMTDSVIRVFQISSFDKKRLIKFIGKANSPVLRKVRGTLRKHFGL